MTLQINSISRAIEGARFFGPRLGPKAVAIRCRVVNRCFDADEGDLNALMKTLDKDVVVIDPRTAEAAFSRDFSGARTMQDFNRVAEEIIQRKLKDGKDVPMVEDFPLAPEEETPEFRDLAITLQLRGIRALEHWNGNTHLTLAAIIMRSMKQGAQINKNKKTADWQRSHGAVMQTEIPSEYQGWWRIIETSQWVNDDLDILGTALISLTGYDDRLRMFTLLAYVNCKPAKSGVSFTWKGAWEFVPMSGSGRVTLGKDGRLRGAIRIKDGDSSTFIAVRSTEPAQPIADPPSYRDKWRKC